MTDAIAAPQAVEWGRSVKPLWSERQAAQFFGVGERTFADMRKAGLVPEPIVLGPRLLRWLPDECEAAARAMPRLSSPKEPAQLRRARIERMKAGPDLSAQR